MASPATSPVQTTYTRTKLYTETTRILNTHCLHFLTLSLLFFPLSFSLICLATTALKSYLFDFSGDPKPQFYDALKPLNSIPIILVYTVLFVFPALCGIASNTYSAYRAFHGKPVKISSSIKSLSRSFIPLVSTTVAGLISLVFVSIVFVVSAGAVTNAVRASGFRDSALANWVPVVASIALLLTVVLVLAKWGLAAAIVVVESESESESKSKSNTNWGFEPLRRSNQLVREMVPESLSIILLSGISFAMMMMSNSLVIVISSIYETDDVNAPIDWLSVGQTAAISMYFALMVAHYTAANTVLYVICSGATNNGGGDVLPATSSAAAAAAAETTGEYIKLTIDDDTEEDSPISKLEDETSGKNGVGSFSVLVLSVTLCWSLICTARIAILAW